MLEKFIELARSGKGRRLLNSLNKKNFKFADSDLDHILETYCQKGLKKELEQLKNRRGILNEAQYDQLAKDVKANCSAKKFKAFSKALRRLLSSGMTMNPLKTDLENLASSQDSNQH